VKVFYAGFGAHCYCDSIGRAVYLGPYEFTKREIRKSKMGEALNVWERMFSAGVAGIYRNDGINGFFRGFTITVLRAGPVAPIVLPIYDIALEFLQAY